MLFLASEFDRRQVVEWLLAHDKIEVPTGPTAASLVLVGPHDGPRRFRLDDPWLVLADDVARSQSPGWSTDTDTHTLAGLAAGSSEVARLRLPNPIRIGAQFDWQAQACQGTDCTVLTARESTRVSPTTGAGSRPGPTRLKFAVGDHVGAQVDVGTGNLLVTFGDLTLPGINGDTGLGAAYNSASIGTDANCQLSSTSRGRRARDAGARYGCRRRCRCRTVRTGHRAGGRPSVSAGG